MDRMIRRKLEMAVRVRDFGRAHPFADPSHVAVVARFEEGLARTQALAVQEQAGRLDSVAATRHRKGVRRQLEIDLMRYLARVGEVAAKDHPELAGRFRAPHHNANNATLLARAWDMLNLAKANQDVLVGYGLAGSQLEDLATTLTRFEAATEKANAGRRNHVGARADLQSVTAQLMDAIGLLEVLYRTRFRDDAERLASWESARNVVGPFRGKPVEPPTDAGLGKAA